MKRRYYKRKSLLEEIMFLLIKPPKWIYIAGAVIFVGATIFGYDFFYWFAKIVNYFWIDKVIKIINDILEFLIPAV